MRNITEQAINAFTEGKPFKKRNTKVRIEGDIVILLLHNNEIAKIDSDGTWVTDAGWNTNTTRERLNGIPRVDVRSKKGQLTINGHSWDGSWKNILEFENG